MALSSAIQWEVRTGGADTNGGGFKAGASGTDWTLQNSAQYALTGLTTAAANAIILTASAATDMVGNVIQITGGTNFTTGFYEITSVSAGVSITVDRNCTTAAGAAGTGNIGGALLTISTATGKAVDSNTIYVKSGTYSISSAIPITTAITIKGYQTSRTDFATRPLIQASTGSFNLLTYTSSVVLIGLDIDGNNQSSTKCIVNTSGTPGLTLIYCRLQRATNGLQATAFISTLLIRTEIDNNSGTGIVDVTTTYIFWYCHIHNNGGNGLSNTGNGSICTCYFSIIASNSGVGLQSRSLSLYHSIIYGNTGTGIYNSEFGGGLADIYNSIIYNNGGYGADFVNTSLPTVYRTFYTAMGSNTSGNFNPSYSPSISIISLTANPFVDAANGNFALNNVTGGGASCRAVGFPGTFPGGTTVGYLDIGAIQHKEPTKTEIADAIWTYADRTLTA